MTILLRQPLPQINEGDIFDETVLSKIIAKYLHIAFGFKQNIVSELYINSAIFNNNLIVITFSELVRNNNTIMKTVNNSVQSYLTLIKDVL